MCYGYYQTILCLYNSGQINRSPKLVTHLILPQLIFNVLVVQMSQQYSLCKKLKNANTFQNVKCLLYNILYEEQSIKLQFLKYWKWVICKIVTKLYIIILTIKTKTTFLKHKSTCFTNIHSFRRRHKKKFHNIFSIKIRTFYTCRFLRKYIQNYDIGIMFWWIIYKVSVYFK